MTRLRQTFFLLLLLFALGEPLSAQELELQLYGHTPYEFMNDGPNNMRTALINWGEYGIGLSYGTLSVYDTSVDGINPMRSLEQTTYYTFKYFYDLIGLEGYQPTEYTATGLFETKELIFRFNIPDSPFYSYLSWSEYSYNGTIQKEGFVYSLNAFTRYAGIHQGVQWKFGYLLLGAEFGVKIPTSVNYQKELVSFPSDTLLNDTNDSMDRAIRIMARDSTILQAAFNIGVAF